MPGATHRTLTPSTDPQSQLQQQAGSEYDPDADSNVTGAIESQRQMLQHLDDSFDDVIERRSTAFQFFLTANEVSCFIIDLWRYDQARKNESSNKNNSERNAADEVIDLSLNDSDATVQNVLANRCHKILTEPDLQLSWLSDSSSNEFVYTIHNCNAARKSQSNVGPEIESNDVAAIDSTASDDDSSNGPPALSSSMGWSRKMIRDAHYTHYESVMRSSSSYHDDRYIMVLFFTQNILSKSY